jgi:hypothetical protein
VFFDNLFDQKSHPLGKKIPQLIKPSMMGWGKLIRDSPYDIAKTVN